MRKISKIKAFREEEANYIIKSFIACSLPWRVWIGKVNSSVQIFFNFLKFGKFRTVVQGKRFNGNRRLHHSERPCNGVPNGLAGLIRTNSRHK